MSHPRVLIVRAGTILVFLETVLSRYLGASLYCEFKDCDSTIIAMYCDFFFIRIERERERDCKLDRCVFDQRIALAVL